MVVPYSLTAIWLALKFVPSSAPGGEAAERGAKEITFTIISITVSLLAVFIPIVMMGGLALGTLITLGLIPALYAAFYRVAAPAA